MPKENPASAIYPDNLVQTCSNQAGLQTCHPGATPQFAQGRIHPAKFKTGIFDNKQAGLERKQEIEKGKLQPFKALLGQTLNLDPDASNFYQNAVLALIKYGYMMLIGGLISFMIIHQLLDYFATRREHRDRGRHI
jgi:hypothetical protein